MDDAGIIELFSRATRARSPNARGKYGAYIRRVALNVTGQRPRRRGM